MMYTPQQGEPPAYRAYTARANLAHAATPTSTNNTTSLFDISNVTELTRLMVQHRFLAHHLGGVVPERGDDLSDFVDVLDLACGAGSWACDVAYLDQALQVVGMESDGPTLAFARAMAASQSLDNVVFLRRDLCQPLDFFEGDFDLVNGRFLSSVLTLDAWQPLLRECLRVLRPGGVMRLTEAALPATNSPAYEELAARFALALHRDRRTLSPERSPGAGAPAMLAPLLREAGFARLHEREDVIDFSAYNDAYEVMRQLLEVGALMAQPWLLRMGVLTEATFEALLHKATEQILHPDFRGAWTIKTVWAIKPRRRDEETERGEEGEAIRAMS